jgi:hypothetical protein
MKKVTAILLLFFFTFQSCHKVVYLSDKLMSHPWQISKWYENERDMFRTCRADDIYQFSANDSFTLKTGDQICFTNEKAVYGGHWDMAPDELKMTLIYDNHNYLFHIITLSDDIFEIAYQEDTINYHVTFRGAN